MALLNQKNTTVSSSFPSGTYSTCNLWCIHVVAILRSYTQVQLTCNSSSFVVLITNKC